MPGANTLRIPLYVTTFEKFSKIDRLNTNKVGNSVTIFHVYIWLKSADPLKKRRRLYKFKILSNELIRITLTATADTDRHVDLIKLYFLES